MKFDRFVRRFQSSWIIAAQFGSNQIDWIKSLESVRSKGLIIRLMTYVVSGHSDDGSNILKKFCKLLVIASIHFRKFRAIIVCWSSGFNRRNRFQFPMSIQFDCFPSVAFDNCRSKWSNWIPVYVIQLESNLCDPTWSQSNRLSLCDPNPIYIIEFRHFSDPFLFFANQERQKTLWTGWSAWLLISC